MPLLQLVGFYILTLTLYIKLLRNLYILKIDLNFYINFGQCFVFIYCKYLNQYLPKYTSKFEKKITSSFIIFLKHRPNTKLLKINFFSKFTSAADSYELWFNLYYIDLHVIFVFSITAHFALPLRIIATYEDNYYSSHDSSKWAMLRFLLVVTSSPPR